MPLITDDGYIKGPGNANNMLFIGSRSGDPMAIYSPNGFKLVVGSTLALDVGSNGAVRFTSSIGATAITVVSTTAISVAASGTDYAFQVDTSAASAATGLRITSAAAGSGIALAAISSGTNESFTIDAKGSGTITIAGTSTGAVTISRALLVSGVLSAGTTPTTLTDAAGKVLSAALNTVAVAQGGTGLTAGTSGGVLAYTATGTLASSGALTANALVLGGGAGAVPTALGSLGTTTTLLHGNAAGAPTFAAVTLTTDVTGILPGANGGTNNAFMDFTGPTTSLKTFTLPDASTTILTTNAAVTVAQGGTGITAGTSGGVLSFTATGTLASSVALTANALVLGGGAGATPTPMGSLGTTTTVLHGNAAGAPTFAAVSLTADVSGILPTANGGTGMAFFTVAGPTTARIFTFPDAAATVLTTNAAVTVAQGGTGIASGTSGGIPYFSAATTIASSGALTASAIVLGGGAGASPTSLALGTANQVVGMNSGATAHEYKSFAVGTSGTDFAVAHSANTVTFNLPDASATARGVVTTGTQTFAGAKTFSSAATFSSTTTTTGNVLQGGAAGDATSSVKLLIKKTGIADNTATDVITVTVPNGNHAACIKLRILSSNGSTDAFESSRCAEGLVVLTRTTGVATVAAVAALDLTQIATVAAGATHTLAYGVSAMTGAAGATQTFTIQLTIDDSGNLGSNQAVIQAEVINAEASGVTIAAA